jgi:uncharacterized protein (TIGR01777 family)
MHRTVFNPEATMNVFITGGLGFVGRYLTQALLDQGHEVTVTGTRQAPDVPDVPDFRYIPTDTTRPGPWQQEAAKAEVLVNLAGRNIFKRWSTSYKQQLHDSRILTTRNLVAALDENSPATLISTSAVGYYGNRGDDLLEEAAASGTDFLAGLSRDWEAEALAAETRGARVAIPRFGIILGTDGGALGKMLPAFRMFLGGPIGNGRHWVPWIHMADVVAGILFMIGNPGCRGAYNFSAPEPVRYNDFSSALGRALGRPAVLRAPAFAIRMAMGELGDVLLGSQRAVPRRLLAEEFEFQFKTIESALADLAGPERSEI